MFKLKPFEEALKMTKQAMNDALAPIRARAAKAKASLEVSKLEEQMLTLEAEIHQLCAEKELDFSRIIEKMDKYALAEHRYKQIGQIVEDLFPSTKETSDADTK